MTATIYQCPVCHDTGYVLTKDPEGNLVAGICRCRELQEARRQLEKSGLAKVFRGKSFGNYNTYGHPVLEDAKKTAMKYAENFDGIRDTENGSLMFCGQVGAGKTHLGTACSMELLHRGIPVLYMGYRESMTALKAKVMDEEAYEREISAYKKAEVLFIDDFLKGRITEADVNILYEIINYRYNNCLPVIISTEKKLDELICFDEAIGSRLIEMCRGHIVVFEGAKLNHRLYRGGVS